MAQVLTPVSEMMVCAGCGGDDFHFGGAAVGCKDCGCINVRIVKTYSQETVDQLQARISELEAQGEPVATVGETRHVGKFLDYNEWSLDGLPVGTPLYLHAPHAVQEGEKKC